MMTIGIGFCCAAGKYGSYTRLAGLYRAYATASMSSAMLKQCRDVLICDFVSYADICDVLPPSLESLCLIEEMWNPWQSHVYEGTMSTRLLQRAMVAAWVCERT